MRIKLVVGIFLLILVVPALGQLHFKFVFKPGTKFHYHGSLNYVVENENSEKRYYDTIVDFTVVVDTVVSNGNLSYIKFQKCRHSDYNKISKDSFNIDFCNGDGQGLLFYDEKLYWIDAKQNFYQKFFANDLLIKKLIDSPDLQDNYDDIGINPFIDTRSNKSCEYYRTSGNNITKSMEGEFYCFQKRTNIGTSLGGEVNEYWKKNWIKAHSPQSIYYYSDNYFIPQFADISFFNETDYVSFELTLFKIE